MARNKDKQSTEYRVIEAIAEAMLVAEDQVELKSRLDDMEADSIDHIELCMMLEEKFGIAIDDSEYARLKTVSDLIRMVERKIQKAAA